MPIRAFLVMHVSVCLLITTTCSAVFARFGWLNRFGTADRSVFLFERLFQLFEGVSCRLAEQLRATAGADECWFVVQCFCLQTFLFVLLWLTCSAPQLPRLVGLVNSFFGFELAVRQTECRPGALPVVVFIRFLSCCAAIFPFFLTDCCVLFRLLAHF